MRIEGVVGAHQRIVDAYQRIVDAHRRIVDVHRRIVDAYRRIVAKTTKTVDLKQDFPCRIRECNGLAGRPGLPRDLS